MCKFICVGNLCCAVYCYCKIKLAISETALVSKQTNKKREWCPLID